MITLKNKTALITGGTKGIGLGIATALLQQGMRVAITGRSSNSVNLAMQQLKGYKDGQTLGIVSDVRQYAAEEKAVGKVIQEWSQLDVLVANAGVGHFAAIDDLSVEQWHEVIDINLTGVFNSIKASIDALKESKGYIITISSLAGTNFFAKGAAYNASKFGLVGFTQAIMLDLRPYDIKVTTIMPGSVTSYFNNHQPNESDHWKIHPDDIGKLVIDLLTMHPRSLPSKIEVRPSKPPSA